MQKTTGQFYSVAKGNSRKEPSVNVLLLLGLVCVAALVRVFPHPPNLLPTTAMALFVGAYMPSVFVATGVLFVSLLASDVFLGFHSTMPFVYGALFLVILAGTKLQAVSGKCIQHRALALLGLAVGSSVFFFLLSNLGVFLVQDLYPKNVGGLIACYVAALPFFENSLIGDVLYSALLFGSYEYVIRETRQRVPVLSN